MSLLVVPANFAVSSDDSSRLTAAMRSFEDHMKAHPKDCMPTVMEGLIPVRDYIRPDTATEPLHVLNPEWVVNQAVRRTYQILSERGFNPRFDYRINLADDRAFESFALRVHRQHDSRILCGRLSALPLLQDVGGITGAIIRKSGYAPKLTIVYFGDNADDTSYRDELKKQAAWLGVIIEEIQMAAKPEAQDLRDVLHKLNNDSDVDAVLVQTIRDKELNHIVRSSLSVNKDPENVTMRHMGEVMTSTAADVIRAPSTAMSILALAKEAIAAMPEAMLHREADAVGPLQGVAFALFNDTPVIGRPLHPLLSNERATFTSLNRFSPPEWKAFALKNARVIVTATGCPDIVKVEDIGHDVTIIDAAIKREGTRIRGDVNTQAMLDSGKIWKITPVPGGVGPRTVAELLRSTAYLAKAHHHRRCPRPQAAS